MRDILKNFFGKAVPGSLTAGGKVIQPAGVGQHGGRVGRGADRGQYPGRGFGQHAAPGRRADLVVNDLQFASLAGKFQDGQQKILAARTVHPACS